MKNRLHIYCSPLLYFLHVPQKNKAYGFAVTIREAAVNKSMQERPGCIAAAGNYHEQAIVPGSKATDACSYYAVQSNTNGLREITSGGKTILINFINKHQSKL